MRTRATVAVAVFLSLASATAARGDEGMWTFDAFPAAKVSAAYGFAPDKRWLDRVQKASVRLDGGCSASVVSKDGLVLTNHHCVVDCVQKLSSARNDLVSGGFISASRKEEKICPGAEASILQSISDVTTRVKGATLNVPAADVGAKRAAEIAAIESEACGDDARKRCEVVNRYRGGQYKLYTYRRFQDVRLAFAPELQAGFFGGDPDNFNFPRYAFDMALVRLYEDGKPARFSNPLKFETAGPAEGDLVFVSGHPGGTSRLLTVSQLEFERDQFLPWRIEYLAQLRGSLLTQGTKGEEEARQVADALFGVENSVKAFKGRRGALVEPAFFGVKVAEEKRLRDALAADPALRSAHGDPFADIDGIVAKQRALFLPYQMLEVRFGAGSVLLDDARTLFRAATERAKPAGDRLEEFAPAKLTSTEQALTAEAAVNPSLEELQVEFWLTKTREILGPDHPAVKAMFGARSARQIAADIVLNSRLDDPSVRKRLWDNPQEAMNSNDPAIALVRLVDGFAREARSTYRRDVSGPISVASSRIAAIRFAVLGDAVYPDATFTLRLSYGAVKGWNDPSLGPVAPFTQVGGLWERATGAAPFDLAPRWQAAKSKLDPTVMMNLVTTNDIIGGNSGSPLLNKEGRIVGLVFDGNIHSLGGDYGFDPELNRTVAVASPVMIAGLRDVYGAQSLLEELTSK